MFFSSIRSRLQWVLSPLLLLTLVITATFVYFSSRSELRDALNAQLDLLSEAAAEVRGEALLALPSEKDDYEENWTTKKFDYLGDFLLVIRDQNGSVLYNSMPELSVPSELEPGDHRITLDGQAWHIVVRRTTNADRLYVSGRIEEEARDVALQLVGTAVLPLSLVFGLALLVSIVSVQAGLSPLLKLSQHLETRPAKNLDVIDPSDQPSEIKPIVDALNNLFKRIEQFLRRERQFVDDAAHEIRTPLTVIKAQAQALNPTGMDESNRRRVNNIIAGTDRVARLSNQLLQQAHAEKEKAGTDTIDLRQMIIALATEFDALARQRDVTLELKDKNQTEFLCLANRDDLWTILRNLIENAIRYSGSPGQVLIALTERADGHLDVSIADNGTGIPQEERTKVFQRFYRGTQVKDNDGGIAQEGAGLGLSIVLALAERNNIDVSVARSERLGGADFRVSVLLTRQKTPG
ncbi:sensor histidine kinase [Roseibium sp.]|uniref:sensor histidine kinase n=1 Tax=Roseibium sp. TaxID=1936156 RepID=UPI003BB03E72